MDLGNYNSIGFISPVGGDFERECWHYMSQFGSGNLRPCLACGKIANYIELFHCAHCNDMHEFSEYWITEEGKWIVDPEDFEFEYFVNDIVYRCYQCDNISINPERKTIIQWLKPNEINVNHK